MSDDKKMDAILAAIPWRCFHCDFITNDPAEAQAHFGDQDDASEFVPICKWWSGMPEVAQAYVSRPPARIDEGTGREWGLAAESR